MMSDLVLRVIRIITVIKDLELGLLVISITRLAAINLLWYLRVKGLFGMLESFN